MKNWKSWIVPLLLALMAVVLLITAVVKPLTRGEPLNYSVLFLAVVFLTLAVVSFARGRKSGGGSGPPSA